MGKRCLTPKTLVNRDGDVVPCGKCPNCRAKRVSNWSVRLMQELKDSTSAHFLTLTYDTNSVHITPNGFMDLSKRDVQLFFKRLRKAHAKNNAFKGRRLKYYLCGEYGGRSFRPHYHIILFNAAIELIQPAWQLGMVHYGDERGVNEASVGYTLKYISKPNRIPLHRNDDRTPEFSLMSKGLAYLTSVMPYVGGILKI